LHPEDRHIGAPGNLDRHPIRRGIGIVLAQPPAQQGGLGADHGIEPRIEIGRTAEDQNRYGGFLDLPLPSFQSFLDDEAQEGGQPGRSRKTAGSYHASQAALDAGFVRDCRRSGC
jgi:hypothetical protein